MQKDVLLHTITSDRIYCSSIQRIINQKIIYEVH